MGDPQAQVAQATQTPSTQTPSTQTPPAQAPDSAEQILRSTQGLDDNVRADAWDAYHNSANEDELAGKLQNMQLPQDVKANLWDAKHSAHPPQAQPQPPGAVERYAQRLGEGVGLPTTVEAATPHPSDVAQYALGPAIPLASGLYEYGKKNINNIADAYQEHKQAMQNIKEGGPVLANTGKAITGIAKANIEAIPFVGEGIWKEGEDLLNKNYAGMLGDMTSTALQILLPEILEKSTAGGRAQSLLEEHKSNTVQLKAREAEHSQQVAVAAQMQQKAEAIHQAEAAGQATAQDRIKADNDVSLANSEVGKAQKVLTKVRDAQAKSGMQLESLTNKIAQKQAEAARKAKGVGTPEEIQKSNDAFKTAIPPAKGKAAYNDADLKAVRPVLEQAHGDTAVDNPQAVVDALETDRAARDEQVKGAVEKYKDEPIKVTDDEGNGISLKQKLIENLAEDEKTRPGFTEAALKELERFNTTDMSVGEGDALRKTLNTENRSKLNTPQGWRSVADMRETDPEFAARYELQDILRDGVYGVLEDHGVANAREARQFERSSIKVRNAAERLIGKEDVKVGGTNEASPVGKIVAKVAPSVGAGTGAAIGVATGIPGAPEVLGAGGAMVGKKVAGVINPGNLTRGELLKQSLDVKHGLPDAPRVDMTGSTPSNPPAMGQPPVVAPIIHPLENSPLHSELAAHYPDMEDASYEDLEKQLIADVKLKTKYGVSKTDPDFKADLGLYQKVKAAKMEQELRARGQHEEQVKAAEQAAKEAEAKREKDAAAGIVTNLRPPFETTDHVPVPAKFAKKGYTPQRVGVHELGHEILVDDAGHPTGEIINHNHDQIDRGSLAEARWDKSAFLNEDGEVDLAKLQQNLPDLLRILHGGVVAEELIHDIPVHENPSDDLDVAEGWARKALESPDMSKAELDAEVGKVMKTAEMEARERLTAPGVLDIMKRYTEHREAGIPNDIHMTAGTVGKAVQEAKHARGENGKINYKTQVNAKGNEGARESEAGGKGAVEGKSKKAVQSAGEAGTATGEGKPGKGTEPRTNLQPGAGTATADREENRGAGAPGYAYRSRDIGETGIPKGGYTATASEEEARSYLGDREKVTGKPQELVRVPLEKAGEHVREAGPRGNDWFKFKNEIPEEHVEKVEERPNLGTKGEPTELKTNLRPDRVSTRVPTAKPTKSFTPEEHMGEEPLTIGREAVDKDPRIQQKLADVVKKYPGFKFPEGLKDPAKILDRFTAQVKDNLLHLWDSVAPEKRTANAKWYESVNKKANADAGEHGIQPRQAAGVYASLSPQKDWDMNASLARRVMDTHFNHANDVGSPKMTDFGQGLVDKARADAENKMAAFKASGEKDPVIVQRKQGAYERKLKNATDLEAVVKKISGQKYSDLTDPYEKGVWIRLHDEVNNPRNYPKIDPGTGNPLEDVTNADGSKSKVAWGSMEPIARAVSILQDGSRENISEQLGGEHKVRNFYNNIIDPTHPEDVTIDTHAVAAGHMQPFSGQSKEVTNNFGSAGKSAQTGVHGSYPLYAEGYRQAAKERGVKAREMQSVTWEKIRELFPAEIKDADFQKQAQKIMKKVSDGKITIKEARKQITDAAVDKRMGQMAGKAKQSLDNPSKVGDNDISAGAAALGGK